MIALKAMQTCFTTPAKDALLLTRIITKKKNSIVCLCQSKDDENSDDTAPEGDTRKQELLARIAMLQTQKVRLTDYLDERSTYLTRFAEEANAEIDQIGEDALKGLDEAGSRIMDKIESQMLAFEESAELSKEEIETNEKRLEDFEGKVENDRNEGLFFKNLGQKAPAQKVNAKEEVDKLKNLTKENAGSQTRRNIHLALTGLLSVGFVDGLISSSDWRKVAALGFILVALLSQIIYEQGLLSEREKTEEKNTENEEK